MARATIEAMTTAAEKATTAAATTAAATTVAATAFLLFNYFSNKIHKYFLFQISETKGGKNGSNYFEF